MYRDEVGQFTFESRNGEGILAPEHYTCVCPNCKKMVSGKSKNRSYADICMDNKWVMLPLMKEWILYCSKQCAIAHAPNLVERHRKTLQDSVARAYKALDFWRP